MLKPKKGRFLISVPSMEDPNFFRSVILLAVHNEQESVGFVLNQPTKIKIHHLIKNFPKSDFPIYIGGPVERNSLQEDLIKEISSIVEDSTLLQHFLQICIPSKLPPYVVNYLD
tara:strand:- start:95 stop:436 length:342 start_codon:yes stop_codon:yes gene_type:complete